MPTVNRSDTAAVEETPIPAETLAAIAAAAFAFLGKQLRIRSIEPQPSREHMSRWSRQGRMLVQSSHNLAVKRAPQAK